MCGYTWGQTAYLGGIEYMATDVVTCFSSWLPWEVLDQFHPLVVPFTPSPMLVLHGSCTLDPMDPRLSTALSLQALSTA